MLTYADISSKKRGFIFELDNVLYPEKDYLLQVYYLFSTFIEYTETIPTAAELTEFFKKSYEHHGAKNIFDRAAEAFGIDIKYKDNFERLHIHARLPLKLLLFPKMLSLLQEIVVDRKQIFLITNGNPEQQLNKVRQTEWNGLENYLTVYFADEVNPKPETNVLSYIFDKHDLLRKDLVIIGNSETDEDFATEGGIDYIRSLEFI